MKTLNASCICHNNGLLMMHYKFIHKLTARFSCRGSHNAEFLVNPVAELRDNLEMSELSPGITHF